MAAAVHLPSALPDPDFERLVDQLPLIVWTSVLATGNDFLNQYWYDYTGLTPAESAGAQRWALALHPDDQERTFAEWRRVREAGESFEIEYRLRRHDGQFRWFLGKGQPLRDGAGDIVKWFGTCTDIDEQKRTETALREREQQLDTLANNFPQLAWMADPTGHIFWYNRRWYAYTATTFAEMEGWGWTKVHHPEHVARVVERWSAALQAGQPWEDTFPLRGADGQYRWFLSHAEPIRDADGCLVRWFGSNTDVTEQRLLQDQLRSSYADLEAKVTFRTLNLEREVARLKGL